MSENFDDLVTESRNPASEDLDRLSALEIVQLMGAEDRRATEAVAGEAAAIARAVEVIAARLEREGRLIYVGAGTSGRLGVLDAVECPPTFCTAPDRVVGVIAGGTAALTRSVEGAEDDPEAGRRDLDALATCERDVVVGIAASGRTPYVLGAVARGREVGAATIGLSCNPNSPLALQAELAITPVVGPEVVSGSTRLKAGTATKMVLNMLTTGAMVRLGKTYGNAMVDVQATNDKLRARARRIVAQITGVASAEADALLQRCGGEVKTCVVAQRRGVSPEHARRLLDAAGGRVRDALAGEAAG